MSGRFSRGRRYSRSRSYKSYPKRSSLIRRSVGNMRAAKRQNDLSNTTISGSTLKYIISVKAGDEYGYQTFNIWDSLNDSPMFRTLRLCYDQIRINNVKVKFSLLVASSMSGTNCPVFATVWDRNGFHPGQYKAGTTDFMDGSKLDWDWETFASYSSFDKRSMSSGSAFNSTVSIYPSSMAEKSMYVSTVDVFTPAVDGADSAQIASPLSNPSLPFKPQIVSGIYVAKALGEQTFVFSIDWEIDASFRGMHASTGQVSPRVDRLTHVLLNDVAPWHQQSMSGAAKMGSVFSVAEAPGTITVNAGRSCVILDYQEPADIWEVKFYRNASINAIGVSVGTGHFFVTDQVLSRFVHFGKGAGPADKIFTTGAAPYTEGAQVATQCNYYVSGQVVDFDGTA